MYRQWLNSDAPAVELEDSETVSNWWRPTSKFDTAPNGIKLAGFLHGLDKKFIDSLGEVEVVTVLSDCDVGDDGVRFETTYDKVFLQSVTNVFNKNEGGIAEGEQLEYWKNKSDNERIKYFNGTPRTWWLRTPFTTSSRQVHNVWTSGKWAVHNVNCNHGIVPTCCICGKQVIKDNT